MVRVGSALQFAGGKIGGLALSGLLAGCFIVLAGVTPAQFFAAMLANPPPWVPWVSPALVILGLVLIWASLRFNIWSQRQKAIDSLAEDIRSAIVDLVNRLQPNQNVERFEQDFADWCASVSNKLENRAFFTRADQLHFDMLGYLEPIAMGGHERVNRVHTMLKLKLDRLRDIINWTQERRR